MKRKTKIVCTIGPATIDTKQIAALINSGMNIARINLSHGDYEQHRLAIKNIREAAASLQQSIPIIGDLCGPKIRIERLDNEIILNKDEFVNLYHGTYTAVDCDKALPVSYDKLNQDTKIGDKILIDDGLIELKIVAKKETATYCKVVTGGIVRSNKGVNFPDTNLSVPSLTDKDKADIAFLKEQKAEFLALSFVRNSNDILELIEYLKTKDFQVPIIAKIEKPQAIEDIDEIIQISDVIMIARGDLGVEMNAYEVPILQKQIIRKCLVFNKPVITATQMLESMINSPRCTRAEASDVANAVFDGTDAVMLSAETSIGEYPVTAVDMMHSILLRAENAGYLRLNLFEEHCFIDNSQLAIDLSKAACSIASDVNASYIIAMTKTGRTARFLAKYRTKTPIVAFTPNKETMPILSITWGVTGVLIDSFGVTDEILAQSTEYMLKTGWLQKGEFVVYVTGSPMLETNEINMIKIGRV